jgi:hypothetical protein
MGFFHRHLGAEHAQALHHAVHMSEFGIAKRLVELGADQTVRNNEGKLARDLCWSGEWEGIGLTAD